MPLILQFFKDLGPTKLVGWIVGILLFIAMLFSYSTHISSSDMSILYADLELTDSHKIVQELESKRVKYELSAGGTVIKVPSDQVLKLRVALAHEGIPSSGSMVGYEIFDKEESLGSTSFIQNVKMLRALEGELSRTIESFESVDKARVHLVMPKKELFSKERQDTRASVILKLKASKEFSKEQIDAVSHLIASSVPELDVKNITIVDTKGRSLKLSVKDEADSAYTTSVNDERKFAVEMKLKNTIESMLERTVGAGKVIAEVSTEMNFDRIIKNSEEYNPDGSVLRSTQTVSDKEKTPVISQDGVDVSVANNLPGGQVGGANSMATHEHSDETMNYEISKTIINQVSDVGKVTKLSVAVLVDGNYKPGKTPKDKPEYIPLTSDEIKNIENLVKVAVGFSEDRQDQLKIINMQFSYPDVLADETNAEWIKEELPGILKTVVIAAVIILIFLGVVRPIVLKAFDIQKSEVGPDGSFVGGITSTMSALAPSAAMVVAGSNIEPLSGANMSLDRNDAQIDNKSAETAADIKRINDSMQQSPQEVLLLIRRWLHEDPGA